MFNFRRWANFTSVANKRLINSVINFSVNDECIHRSSSIILLPRILSWLRNLISVIYTNILMRNTALPLSHIVQVFFGGPLLLCFCRPTRYKYTCCKYCRMLSLYVHITFKRRNLIIYHYNSLINIAHSHLFSRYRYISIYFNLTLKEL